jgi:hypothetical protein
LQMSTVTRQFLFVFLPVAVMNAFQRLSHLARF